MKGQACGGLAGQKLSRHKEAREVRDRPCSHDCMHWAAAEGAEGAQTEPHVGQRELSPLAKIL